MVVAADADAEQVALAVRHSLDRKVCNTLNVCCLVRSAAHRLAPVVLEAGRAAATSRDAVLVVHATSSAVELVAAAGITAIPQQIDELGTEWEWENDPEFTIVVVDDVAEAVELFNRYSPRFAASLLGGDESAHRRFYDSIDAPFVGDGFTRWVDGQFAFDQPELGLSNWQAGRLFARGGVLSGDSVHTVRTRAHVSDHRLHR
jgi:glutamate-5-semialdehyde dehydrogenase